MGFNYYFYINDHLGNNRIVANAAASVVQSTQYYPFGMLFADATGPDVQPYKYNNKELDGRNGLNMYDYSARQMDFALPGFTSVDPHAEKYYSISPYAYCFNNPLRWIDKDGRDPGDPFKSPTDAAKDFAKYYGHASINMSKEFGSTIYIQTENEGVKVYSYSIANIGQNERSVVMSDAPNGETEVALIHSHGSFLKDYGNNEISDTDKKLSDKLNMDGYVVTPNGTLQKYDVGTKDESIITTVDIPSDPNDPDRKNKVEPVKDSKPVYYDREKKEYINKKE